MIYQNKYRATKTDGFPSRLESAVYGELLFRQNCGEIREILRQQTVVLQQTPRIAWKIDFSAIDNKTDELFYIEAKGFETVDFKIKLKLYAATQTRRLEIYKGNYRRPFIYKIINAAPPASPCPA